MTDFTRSFDIMIDAPVHEVFEYCRDPHHLFEGWPMSVDVEGGLDAGVAESRCDDGGMGALCDEESDMAVTEVMEPRRLTSGVRKRGALPSRHSIRM